MRLELSRRAETDLADIRAYSFEQFGGERAIQRHRIFYTVTGDAILIERVLHQAMDVGRQL